jgi:hypothetical protein
MIAHLVVFYKQQMPFSAGKYMDKIGPAPYKKGIRSTWMAADAFVLRIFSEYA